jgi:hypothetical protein
MTHDLWHDLIARFGQSVAEELAREYVAVMRKYVMELLAQRSNEHGTRL